MQLIAELGSNFQPGRPETLLDAAKAAMSCGADCVKLQVYNAEELARRRGCGPEKLAPWAMDPKQFSGLAGALAKAKIPFGASVFGGTSANIVAGFLTQMAFLKTATQEYQCASLAERVSAYAASAGIPLYVSMPPDACCVVGNYWSPLPITWLFCVPHYPANFHDYVGPYKPMSLGSAHSVTPTYATLSRMFDSLPGRFGISDHTPDRTLAEQLRSWLGEKFSGKLVAWEKHFCYDESLRDKVPDGGPWSLNRKAFTEFAREVKA